MYTITLMALLSCHEKQPTQQPSVPPGSAVALYTDPSGKSTMITQLGTASMKWEQGATISTTPGATFILTFSDHSLVILNAASSITIGAYSDTKRVLSLSGEAYFDITSNPQVPFTVRTTDATVTALGTSFNVLAYGDEPERKITLIQGALQVASKEGTLSLQPGQQVIVNQPLQAQVADTAQALAWKEGFYDPSDASSLVRQLARWHGLTPVFNTPLPKISFEGQLPRSAGLSSILKILQANGITLQYDRERKLLRY